MSAVPGFLMSKQDFASVNRFTAGIIVLRLKIFPLSSSNMYLKYFPFLFYISICSSSASLEDSSGLIHGSS